MGKHDKNGTADDSDTHAGGSKMGKHEKGFDKSKKSVDETLKKGKGKK